MAKRCSPALLGQSVMRDLRMEIFAHLQRLSIAFFDRNPAGRLITRVTSDVETLNELFTSGVVSGLGDLFTLLAIGVAMFLMDWRLTLAALVVIPFVAGVSHWFRTSVREAYRDIRTRSHASTRSFRNESPECGSFSCSVARRGEGAIQGAQRRSSRSAHKIDSLLRRLLPSDRAADVDCDRAFSS